MMELPKHLNPKISKLKGKLLAAHKKKHTHTHHPEKHLQQKKILDFEM